MAVLFVMRKLFSVSAAGNRHFHLALSSISVSGGLESYSAARIFPVIEDSCHTA